MRKLIPVLALLFAAVPAFGQNQNSIRTGRGVLTGPCGGKEPAYVDQLTGIVYGCGPTGTYVGSNSPSAINLKSLGSPAVTFTQGGTGGSTSYTYAVIGTDSVGNTRSLYATDTAGNATLNSTNFNIITVAVWPTGGNNATPVGSCKVYRTISNGTPSSTGLIGTIGSCAAGGNLHDTGLAGDSTTPPTDTSGVASAQFFLSSGSGSGSYSGAPLLGSAPAMGPIIDCTGCSLNDTIGYLMMDSASSSNPKSEVVMKSNGQVEYIVLNHLGYVNSQVGSAGSGEYTSYNSLQIDTANNADISIRPGGGAGGANTGSVHLGGTSGGGVFSKNWAAEGTGASAVGSGGACATLSLPVQVGYIFAAVCGTAATGATTITITPPAGTPTPINAFWCDGADVGGVGGGGGQGTRGVQSGYSNATCTVIFPTGVIQNDIIITKWGWF